MARFRIFTLFLLFSTISIAAPLKVVTTLHVLADIAKAVGGSHVEVRALAGANQDPHFIQPTPTLMKQARTADLFIDIGLDLELWADKVVEGGGNPRIQHGQNGRVHASHGISVLEVPKHLTRNLGDVHPYGNPHIWLDPLHVRKMASNISSALVAVDPIHAVDYKANLVAYQNKLDQALFGDKVIQALGLEKTLRLAERHALYDFLKRKGKLELLGGWYKKAVKLRGQKMVTYHKTWAYFAKRFGISIPATLEEKAGIPPTAKYRDHVVELMRLSKIKLIVEAIFYDSRAANFIAEKTGARVVELPIDVNGLPGIKNYFDLMDVCLDKMLK